MISKQQSGYIIAITLLSFFACKDKQPEQAQGQRQNSPAIFDAIVANPEPLSRSLEVPGTIMPFESTDIHPEISGRVTGISFKEGTVVSKGALLVKLFDEDLRAQLEKLKVQLKVAETTAKRQGELLAINGTSQQDFDNAVLNVSNLNADIELMRVAIGKTEIRAPFNGRIGLRNISLGAYITPTVTIANIAQVNVKKVEFNIPEKYAGEITPGKNVRLRPDASSKEYMARVMALENTIASDTRNLTVRALVQNPDAFLPSGAFVQVKVEMQKDQNALMIPTRAVIPSTRFKRVVVSREGKAVFQVINTGFRDSARVEVLSGLNPGDTIVTTGLLTIKEGMPLKLTVKG